MNEEWLKKAAAIVPEIKTIYDALQEKRKKASCSSCEVGRAIALARTAANKHLSANPGSALKQIMPKIKTGTNGTFATAPAASDAAMNCPDCLRKHLAAALSYAKEIINGHGAGGHPDHRPDFAGEVINAEHHAAAMDKVLAVALRDLRHSLDRKQWTPKLADTDRIRTLWTRSLGAAGTTTPAAVENGTVDIVIPLWSKDSGHNNIELRYALRGIERFAIGFRKIIVITDNPPEWLTGVDIIKMPDDSRKNINLFRKRIAAAKASDAEFNLYCCDDYIFLQPVDTRTVPVLTCNRDMSTYKGSRVWHQCLRATAEALKTHGRKSLHCESHTPSLVHRERFLELADAFKTARETEPGVTVDGLYHNYFSSPMANMDNHKATFESDAGGSDKVAQKSKGKMFLSFNDDGFNSGVSDYLAAMFPNKSKYEVQ